MSSNGPDQQFVKGQKLFVSLRNKKSFEGKFKRQRQACNSIIFRDVTFVPDATFFDQLELKLDEILKIACFEEEHKPENSVDGSVGDSTDTEDQSSHEKYTGLLYEKVKGYVENHVFIDQTDIKFSEAMKTLETTEIIAVTGEGSKMGRFGDMTVLGIATHNAVFLFDIVNLGERAFKAGGSFLKKLLESKHVLKVVHHCSNLSDCLKHRYGVTLQNVFDTQACHLIVTKNSTGSLPAASSFSHLVVEYLKLPGSICDDEVTNPEEWCRRPLDVKVCLTAAWRVALLRKLKAPLDDAFYAPFDKLCQLYLTSVRDQSDELEARIVMHQNVEDEYPTRILSDFFSHQ